MYGTLLIAGNFFFKIYDWFDAKNFEKYIIDMQRYFGKIAVTVNKAFQHQANNIKEIFKKDKNINPMNFCSSVYPTRNDTWYKISEYFKTVLYNMDVTKYFNREMIVTGKNF